MLTYTTLDGEVLDVQRLGQAEERFFERCLALYRDRGDWVTLANLVAGDENPLVAPGHRITRAVMDHPLWRAVRDLEDRLGIIHGEVGSEPGDMPDRDPVIDEFVPVAQVAEERNVSIRAVYKAIDRGDVIATHDRPTRVSRNSLGHWEVVEVRQAAGKARGADGRSHRTSEM
jgi:hypothetical protein